MNKLIYTSYSPNTRKKDLIKNLQIILNPFAWVRGDGPNQIKNIFEDKFDGYKSFTFNYARSGMYILFKSLSLNKLDEILLLGFTCSAAVNPIIWAGAKPIFVDVDLETGNFDLKDLHNKISSKTKAIMFQHTFGNSTSIGEVYDICKSKGIILIEDCTNTIFGYDGEKLIGSFGDASIFSFGRDKAVSGVNGGVILIKNPTIFEKFQNEYNLIEYPKVSWIFRELIYPFIWSLIKPSYSMYIGKAIHLFTTKIGLLTKATSSEEKQGIMPNYIPLKQPNALAQLAITQLSDIVEINEHRNRINKIYVNNLKPSENLKLMKNQNGNVLLRFPVRVNNRDELVKYLRINNVLVGDWYLKPITPTSTDIEEFGYVNGSCPQSELLCSEIVNLPNHINISEDDAKRIASLISKFYEQNIDIKIVKNKNEWEECLDKFKNTTLFLSWNWAVFENEIGSSFESYGVYKDKKLVGLLPIKVIKAKRGKYIHVRHGPLIDWSDTELVNTVINFLKTKAAEENTYFARISPLLYKTYENNEFLSSLGLKQSLTHATDAELTLIIDLSKNLDQIYSEFRKTTRNLIKKAESLGIKIEHTFTLDNFNDFSKIYTDTVQRNKWAAYPVEYIKKEFEIFAKDKKAVQFVAYFEGNPISSSIFILHKDQVIYHYSGSLTQYRELPSSHLLHWEAIKYFKLEGYKIYNFWGISPQNLPKHPWTGLSLFKRGFSKDEREFVHAHDLIVNPLAHLTRAYEFFEAKSRGYK